MANFLKKVQVFLQSLFLASRSKWHDFFRREKPFVASLIVKRGFQRLMFAGRICEEKLAYLGVCEVEVSLDFFRKFLGSHICPVYDRSEKYISWAVLVRNLMLVTVGRFLMFMQYRMSRYENKKRVH